MWKDKAFGSSDARRFERSKVAGFRRATEHPNVLTTERFLLKPAFVGVHRRFPSDLRVLCVLCGEPILLDGAEWAMVGRHAIVWKAIA